MSINRGEHQKMYKHVGVYNDKRCAIVIHLPESPNVVHIVDTESLPDVYHQNLMDIITSNDAQSSKWLAEVLHRRVLFNGQNALRWLYEQQHVLQVPIEKVSMTPHPSVKIPFTDVLKFMNNEVVDPLANMQNGPSYASQNEFDKIVAQEQEKLNNFTGQLDESVATETVVDSNADKHNQHVENLASDVSENNRKTALGLLQQAELLQAEADKKRAEAAKYDPSLLKTKKTKK